jgi:putative transposase
MPNHVHLLVTPRETGAVARTMQDLGRRYVRLFNDSHSRTGTLWEGRYKSCVIDTENYLLTCHRYIELNPVRAKLVDDAANYAWSSHRHYALGASNPLIVRHEAFEALAPNEPERRQAFQSLFRSPIADELLRRIRSTTNQGWAFGSDAFIEHIERTSGRVAKPPKRGPPFKDDVSDSSAPPAQQTMLI